MGLRLQLRARDVDEVANAAAAILWRHGFPEACFVAHSYGTFCASRVTQLHRSVVHSLVSARISSSANHTSPCSRMSLLASFSPALAVLQVLCSVVQRQPLEEDEEQENEVQSTSTSFSCTSSSSNTCLAGNGTRYDARVKTLEAVLDFGIC